MNNTQPSQASAILAMLEARHDQWLPMPLLSVSSGAYNVHSRIAELRKRGHDIVNETNRTGDGKRHSFYRLNTKPKQT